jgi:hypothetical protein
MVTIAGKERDAVVDGCVRPAMRDATGLSESIHNHNREKRIKLVWQWEPMKYRIPRNPENFLLIVEFPNPCRRIIGP